MFNGPEIKVSPESKKGFVNQKNLHTQTLQRQYKYECDPYERARDIQREEHSKSLLAKHANNNGGKPWGVTGKVYKPFSNDEYTYGYDNGKFPEKPRTLTKDPLYGPFKNSNPPKQGYNKTIGKFDKYVEEGPDQKTLFPQLKRHSAQGAPPIWNHHAKDKSMANTTIVNNFRNVNTESRLAFGR